jgi:2-haloacid dehalogenase
VESVVTFDVFSALTDSRTGGSRFFDALAEARGWETAGVDVFVRWDQLNKESQRTESDWVPFRELGWRALATTYSEFGLEKKSAPSDANDLLDSMANWPLWPDVASQSLLELGVANLGLLSNIDDDLLRRTKAWHLAVFAPQFVVTSERVRAYKPNRLLYSSAADILGPYTHVASSARDVRGALTAGIRCVRLTRPGHEIDPDGPAPTLVADSIPALRGLLTEG